jgi:hypothetical protein
MFKDLTLQPKAAAKKQILKEDPIDHKLMKEYSFLNSSQNVIVFND